MGDSLRHDAESDGEPVDFDMLEEDREDFVLLCPIGCINSSTVKFMKGRLYDLSYERNCRIVMSFKQVSFIDSSGLGVIITAHKNCEHEQGRIVFCDLSPLILRTMKMLHIDRMLHLVSDLDSASKAVLA